MQKEDEEVTQTQTIAAPVPTEEDLEDSMRRSQTWRRVILSGIALALVGIGYALLTPKQASNKSFNILDAVSYEALTLIDDPSGGRLSLPSTSLQEIHQFFAKTPDLNFQAVVPTHLPTDWHPDGASLIDYEVAKLAVMQVSNPGNQKAFLFSLRGDLKQLPAANTLSEVHTHMQGYATDRLNFIAWQQDPRTLAILAGTPSVKDLVALSEKN